MFIFLLVGLQDECDKCGETVPRQNDIRALEAIRYANGIFLLMKARHCLPVIRDGVTVCPGSPSRAQYLEGQPRDDRGYLYIAEDEASYRTAWQTLQMKVS